LVTSHEMPGSCLPANQGEGLLITGLKLSRIVRYRVTFVKREDLESDLANSEERGRWRYGHRDRGRSEHLH
jgi:hypothetical protein